MIVKGVLYYVLTEHYELSHLRSNARTFKYIQILNSILFCTHYTINVIIKCMQKRHFIKITLHYHKGMLYIQHTIKSHICNTFKFLSSPPSTSSNLYIYNTSSLSRTYIAYVMNPNIRQNICSSETDPD